MSQVPAQIRAPPTLLSLPCELRDLIYDIVFQTMEPFDMIFAHPRGKGDTRFFVSYPLPETPEADRVPRSPHYLRWLLAIKQICEEGVQQFQRKAVWTLTKDIAIGQALEAMGSVPYVYNRGAPVPVLDHLELDRRDNLVWKIDMKAAGAILRLVSQRPRSQKMRTLSITLCSPQYLPHYPDMLIPARAEFSGLTPINAPALRKMEFIMDSREYLIGRPGQNSTPAFKRALDELGMALIGGKGVKTHETIYVDSELVAVLIYTRKRT